MPIKIYPPVVRARSENPAESFLNNPEMLVLGVTYPTYFDKVIDDPQCIIHSPLPISRPPRTDTKGKGGGSGKFEVSYELTLIASPKHVFSWIIELPPDPTTRRWISTQAKTAAEIAKLIKGTNKVATTPLDTAVGNYRLELVCQPSPKSFYDHILNHEMQHAADFHWLVDAIFGRWVAWRDALAQQDCGFKIKKLDETFKWILAGGDFGDGDPQNYMTAYLEATRNTGDLFHKTAKGARPLVHFRQVVDDPNYGKLAQFDISASTSMANDHLTHTSPPHAHFRVPNVYNIVSEHAEVETTGLLPQLPQGAPSVNQVAINSQESEGMDLGGFF